MAINIKNYVDISTTFPSANVAGRSFGGLVFTAKDTEQGVEKTFITVNDVEYPVKSELFDAWKTYNSGVVVFLTLDEVGILFGKTSDEYIFARNYYNYISPSGRFASRLAFIKIGKTLASGEFASMVDEEEDDIPGDSGRKYLTKCKIVTQDGGVIETPLSAFIRANRQTNLFGSFTFLSYPSDDSSSSDSSPNDIALAALKDVALYNATLDAKYLFVINRVRGMTSAKAVVDECKLFEGIKGTVFVSGMTDVSAYMPMSILASTDYNAGQVVNFMFKQFDYEEASVEDDSTYTQFNQAYVNFYGKAQTNGQSLDFYQRGFNTDGMDTAVYCNEMWFKSICETALMNLLISRERLSADPLGVDLVKLEVIDCCSSAIRNGMFMQKEPSAKDIRAIREIVVDSGGQEEMVGSIEADVSTKGYSVYAYLTEYSNTEKLGPTSEKIIVYYVFYGTADNVRYIKGADILLK